MPLPSELAFTAFLQYSPRGASPVSVQSRSLAHAMKNDSFALTKAGNQRVIPYVARRLREELPNHQCLRDCFAGDVTAVPAPRSAPLVQGGLWPTLKLCEALRAEGIAKDVCALLIRTTAVTKSATAGTGGRPPPEEHYNSLAVDPARPLIGLSARFVIVDDVITRGATSLACFARLRDAFPESPIFCFAFVRTMSGVEVESIMAPVSGLVTTAGHLHREP